MRVAPGALYRRTPRGAGISIDYGPYTRATHCEPHARLFAGVLRKLLSQFATVPSRVPLSGFSIRWRQCPPQSSA
jgi:hypothetical protein